MLDASQKTSSSANLNALFAKDKKNISELTVQS